MDVVSIVVAAAVVGNRIFSNIVMRTDIRRRHNASTSTARDRRGR